MADTAAVPPHLLPGPAAGACAPVPASAEMSVVGHLRKFAAEFDTCEYLVVTVVTPLGRPPHLRVAALDVSDVALPERAEEINCVPRDQPGEADFCWSWGDLIPGATLADKAGCVAYALRTEPQHQG